MILWFNLYHLPHLLDMGKRKSKEDVESAKKHRKAESWCRSKFSAFQMLTCMESTFLRAISPRNGSLAQKQQLIQSFFEIIPKWVLQFLLWMAVEWSLESFRTRRIVDRSFLWLIVAASWMGSSAVRKRGSRISYSCIFIQRDSDAIQMQMSSYYY